MTVNDFKINGTSLTHQPTDHHWQERDSIGRDGNGRLIYPALREYELKWDFLDATEFNEIYTYFLAVGATGSVVASLPQYGNSTYQFYAYSGCILEEPEFSTYFENYYQGVRLLIARIRT